MTLLPRIHSVYKALRQVRRAGLLVLASLSLLTNPATATTKMSSVPPFVCGPCVDCMTWSSQAYDEMVKHEQWWDETFWKKYFLIGLQDFTDRVINTMMVEAVLIGGFMDAQSLLNTQRVLQELSAKAMKNYLPSESVCQMGTLTRSLASTLARTRHTQLIMGERANARHLGKQHMASGPGPDDDRDARLNQYVKTFCDPQDINSGLTKLCGNVGGDNTRHNLDIDFTRAIDTKSTLDIDLTNAGDPTPDERSVFAMASNLYGHEVFKRMTSTDVKGTGPNDNRSSYMDFRSMVAKRSVAENSFNTLIGMKAAGGQASRDHVTRILRNLGLSESDARRYTHTPAKPKEIGAKMGLSYSAQMEILTKKLYQDPAFYAHLMETPANVQRQYAAMQAFGLMQQREIFETIIRSELLLSLIVETEASKYQDYVQNRINTTSKQ